MRAVFVDCTDDLFRVIKSRNLNVPPEVDLRVGSPTEVELVGICNGYDVVFVEHTAITPFILDKCPSIRAIVFMGTGAGTYVDLDDAARRGLRVFTTPGYGDRAVAEHSLALVFTAARRIAGMDRQIRAGIWSPVGGLQLYGRKIAIVGLGGIGTCMADMAGALGMKVAAWNRSHRDHPAYISDLDQVLFGADVVSLHLSLTKDTDGIIDGRRLKLPAKGFILVNTARARLVDEAALLKSLKYGEMGHAALDVFPEEPLVYPNPYVGLDNVTLSAHAAYMTDDALGELWRRTLIAFEELQS